MKKFTILLSMILLNAALGYSQVAINTDGSSPDSSAILDLTSINKGFLLPRMTTVQITGISTPAAGLLVYNTDSSDFYGYNGNKWISLWNTGDTLADWYCGNPITDFRDEQSYTTVQIGTQCWMAENLNIGTIINSSNQTDNDTIEKYCYGNDTTNCETYGGLYQWNEMMQYVTTEGAQGICPTGWHLPTDAEWTDLKDLLGATAGGELKETGTAHWSPPNEGATNSSGFTALPGGYRFTDGSFYGLASLAYFWASRENASYALSYILHFDTWNMDRGFNLKADGFSVRCIKN